VDDYFRSSKITHTFDEHIRAEGLRRVLAVPLMHNGSAIGVLALGRRVDGAPTPHRTTQSEADVLHTGPRQRERSIGEAMGLGRTRQEREHYQYRTVTHEEIDRACLRGPDVQAHPVVAGAHRAGLRGDGLAGPPCEIGVPGRTEADRLGENGGLAHPGDAMQGLLAGVEGRDAQALDGGRELMQASHLFVEGEPRQKVVDALRESQL